MSQFLASLTYNQRLGFIPVLRFSLLCFHAPPSKPS